MDNSKARTKRFSIFGGFGAEKKASSPDNNDTASDCGTAFSSHSGDITENASEASSTTDVDGGTSSSSFRLPINKRDSALQAIGRDIKKLHRKIEDREKAKLHQFVKCNQPKQKARIAELKKLIEKITSQIDTERESGLAALDTLNEKILELENEINRIKSHMYFPSSKIACGRDGVYVGYDDFWIEKMYGKISLKMLPGVESGQHDMCEVVPPRILLVLTGDSSTSEPTTGDSSVSVKGPPSEGPPACVEEGLSARRRQNSLTPNKKGPKQSTSSHAASLVDVEEGIGVRIRLDQFNLKADSSSLAIALDALDLSVVMKVQIILEFVPKAKGKVTVTASSSSGNGRVDNRMRKRSLSNVGSTTSGASSSDHDLPSPSKPASPFNLYEWEIPKKDGLVISVQSFRGPLGIGRNVMSTLVGLVTPMVRTMVSRSCAVLCVIGVKPEIAYISEQITC